jgi:hypothetical protein
MLNWHKHNKAELYSLSGAIKSLDFTEVNGVLLLETAKLTAEEITPALILANIANLNGFSMVENTLFQTVYKNKVATLVQKSKWSQWNIEQTIRYLAEKNM